MFTYVTETMNVTADKLLQSPITVAPMFSVQSCRASKAPIHFTSSRNKSTENDPCAFSISTSLVSR